MTEEKLEPSLFRYIWRHTWKQQIFLLALTALSMPFVYISLDIPKTIINKAIGGVDIPESILGYPVDQISYLFILSFAFLFLITLNGGFKYYLNVYRGVLGERMLRRFRFDLYSRIMRFPLPHFKRTSQGEIIPMITIETEPLGGFIGDSFALPAFQGGLLLTYLGFIFAQDVLLGLAAVALYPPQMWLIPKLQKKVNALAKQRVQAARKLSDRVGESIAGITEIHAHDTSHYERADISNRLGTIFGIRYEIYKRKFFIKFLNNFLGQVTPFFFFSVGGYFVINGQLSLGALVAVLAAYKDIADPWKELLKFYQITEDVRVKYQQVIVQFQPANMFEQKLLEASPETKEPLTGNLVSTNLTYSEDEVVKAIDGASFRFDLGSSVGAVGLSGSGKTELGLLLARLIQPSGGRITIGDKILGELPEAIVGRRMAYVGQNAHMFSGSVRDNLFYGLKHRPLKEPEYEGDDAKKRNHDIKEAKASANSPDDINADWLDYAAAGVEDMTGLTEKGLKILSAVGVETDVYNLGLYGSVDPEVYPDLARRILEARSALRDRLRDPNIASLVELFDRERYNTNMTVSENILFGTPLEESFGIEQLPTNPQVLKVLHDTGLYGDFLSVGRRLAEIMLDLFTDVPSDSELFEQFSFISADDLPAFHSLLKRSDLENLDSLPDEDRNMLLSLPFKLIPARHRLGLIDEPFQARLLEARAALAETLGAENTSVSFFDPDRYDPIISIQDNILFGRLAYGQGQAQAKVGDLIRETVDTLSLREDIIRAGLDYEVGIAGARLSLAQRQKLAFGRALMKDPDVLIVNEASGGLDPAAEERLTDNLIEYMRGRSLVWVLSRPELARRFEQVMVVEKGKVVEQVPREKIEESPAYERLLNSG